MAFNWFNPFGPFSGFPRGSSSAPSPQQQQKIGHHTTTPTPTPVNHEPMTEADWQDVRKLCKYILLGVASIAAGAAYVAVSTLLKDHAIENQFKAAQREVGLNPAFVPIGKNYKITAEQGSCLHMLDANNTETKLCFPKGTVVSGVPAVETLADKQSGTRRLQVSMLVQGFPEGFALPMRDVTPLNPVRDSVGAAKAGASSPTAQP